MPTLFIKSFDNKKTRQENKHITNENFYNISLEEIVNFHEKKKGLITYFYFENELSNEQFCVSISQNNKLIKKLNMLEADDVNNPQLTKNLFNEDSYQVDTSKIEKLIPLMENNILNTFLVSNAIFYSFQLSKEDRALDMVKTIEKKYINKIDGKKIKSKI